MTSDWEPTEPRATAGNNHRVGISQAIEFDIEEVVDQVGVVGCLWYAVWRLGLWSVFALLGLGLLLAEGMEVGARLAGALILVACMALPLLYLRRMRKWATRMSQGKHPYREPAEYKAPKETAEEEEPPPDNDWYCPHCRSWLDEGSLTRCPNCDRRRPGY